jgi:hypothetical protein
MCGGMIPKFSRIFQLSLRISKNRNLLFFGGEAAMVSKRKSFTAVAMDTGTL